jgi:hypothetical protein
MKIIEDKDYDPNSDEDETAMTARIMTMTQNDDDVINKPSLKPKENSHLGISTLIPLSKLTDEMDPKAKKAAPPSKAKKETPPSKAKCNSIANFLCLEKCEISPCWVWFNVHVNKFNGYQELFQFLITAAQASEVEVPDKCTSLGWH